MAWKKNRSMAIPIGEFIEQLGEIFESIMTSYFEDFKESMKKILRIPVSLVEKHYNDVCFLVDVDYTFVQEVTLRVRWLRPLGYEINVDEASATITTLDAEDIDKDAKAFGNYEMAKSKTTMELKTASILKKKEKSLNKLKKKFGEGVEQEEDEEEEDTQTQAPHALTQRMGEDQQEEEA